MPLCAVIEIRSQEPEKWVRTTRVAGFRVRMSVGTLIIGPKNPFVRTSG